MSSPSEDPVLAVVGNVCEFFVSSGRAKYSEIVSDRHTKADIINRAYDSYMSSYGRSPPIEILDDRLEYYCSEILDRLDRPDVQIVRFH